MLARPAQRALEHIPTMTSRRRTLAICKTRTRGISPAQAAEAMILREWCEHAAQRYEIDAFRQMHNRARAKGVDVAQSENGDRAAIADFEGACLLRVRAFPCPNATDLGTQVHRGEWRRNAHLLCRRGPDRRRGGVTVDRAGSPYELPGAEVERR